jgi:serine/threonine protein kinase
VAISTTSTRQCIVCNAENPASAVVCATCGAALSGDPASGYSSALPTGTKLKGGLYSVGKVLGQGGFGITYLGGDSRARRPVALKEFFPYGSLRRGLQVLPGGGLSTEEFAAARAKFSDEARILAQFHHPGIVRVYDAFEENGTAYMVMEYLRGRSLGALLEERGSLPEAEAVADIRRAGEALEVVHRANLLHRDIKPDNIMLTDDGRVVLIDFGTARTFAAGMTSRMTTMVTPGYAPLEQYGAQVHFGAFTDVYALAATLYHLLTGVMPAPATDRASGVELKSPRQLDPAISERVSNAVMQALEMRVDRRPQTVRAFLDALGPAHTPAPAPPARPVAPPAPSSPSPAPRHSSLPGNGPWEVRVEADQIAWPSHCACCFEPADSAYLAEYTGSGGLFGLFIESRAWEVPYCSRCLDHLRLQSSSMPGGVGPALAGAAAGLLLGGPVGLLVGLGGGAAVAALGSAQKQAELQSALRPTCTAVGPAVSYLGWYGGTHAFCFLNTDFIQALVQANPSAAVA